MTIPSWVKVGQKVKYEIAKSSPYTNMKPYTPRWDFNKDAGGSSGKWAEGEITEVSSKFNKFIIKCLETGIVGTNKWAVPLPGNSRYKEDQWDRLGQIQPIDVPVEKKDSTRPLFMDVKVLDGIKYEVYRHTLGYDTSKVQDAALREFQKVLSRRLREWPTCCNEHVELKWTLAIKDRTTAVFTPVVQCKCCGSTVL